jgi:hypothetical protein
MRFLLIQEPLLWHCIRDEIKGSKEMQMCIGLSLLSVQFYWNCFQHTSGVTNVLVEWNRSQFTDDVIRFRIPFN